MSILRIQKRVNPYVQIDKRPLEDASLSWKAKGLLAYLLSKPDDWEVRIEDVLKRSSDGREAVRSAFRELKDRGYAILKKAVGGGSTWVILEESSSQRDGFPASQESGVSQRSGKSPRTNNEGTSTKNKIGDLLELEEEKTSKKITADGVSESWNKMAEQTSTIPKAISLSEGRKKKLRARLQNEHWAANYQTAIGMIAESPFLMGKNNRKWAANFDWFIRSDDSLLSILEGKYVDRTGKVPGAGKNGAVPAAGWRAEIMEAIESMAQGLEPSEVNAKWWARLKDEAIRSEGNQSKVESFIEANMNDRARDFIDKI